MGHIDISGVEYFLSDGRKLLDQITFRVGDGAKTALVGPNGSGKTTLIRILAGIMPPDSGKIKKQMSVSWPVGYVGGFQNNITGVDNIKFISKIYGADYKTILSFVRSFSDLDEFLDEPLHIYSSGMKARLNFSLMIAIDFDCYLIDELLNVGDADVLTSCGVLIVNVLAEPAIVTPLVLVNVVIPLVAFAEPVVPINVLAEVFARANPVAA
jgi:capsular polysaccharide transport system ATP-binding protein